MNAITLGSPNLFVKGMAEAVITDPATGNIIGYDNVASDAAVTSSVNMGEITGGLNNPLVMNIPDTVRITGTLTSQAFSLEQRKLISGGTLAYNAVVPVCETITAAGTSLSVTGTPVKAYGQNTADENAWCYVREHGASTFVATNYGVNMATKVVADFASVSGVQYDVIYFANSASAQVLTLPSTFNPTVATVRLKFAVYAKQNNSVTEGTLQGYLHFIVPRAQFTGDAGISANQTTNATTDYAWTAVMPDGAANTLCDNCGASGTDLAYYVYVPCGDATQNVEALVTIGDGASLAVGETMRIPVKYYMPDGSLAQPNYTDLAFDDGDSTYVEVSADGIVTAVSAPGDDVTITLARASGNLTATYHITVTD